MFNSQMGCVEHRPAGIASIGHRRSCDWTIVDGFTAEWSSLFAQMDAYLMGSSRLEPAFDQCECTQHLDHANMGDRPLA